MNSAKCIAEHYINFVIATPRVVTATEAERVQPQSENAPAHDALTRLLTRLEPDAESLWAESRSQIDLNCGILILDDSTLEKPYSKRNDLVYRHWSGKQKEVVSGINLITLLWTEGDRVVPCDYRIFDKDRDRKTKNDHFSEMLLEAHNRGFNPAMVCFDSWYGSSENLKLCRGLDWNFLTRLKSNRLVNPDKTGLRAVSEIEIPDAGRVVWLKDFGLVRVFRIEATVLTLFDCPESGEYLIEKTLPAAGDKIEKIRFPKNQTDQLQLMPDEYENVQSSIEEYKREQTAAAVYADSLESFIGYDSLLRVMGKHFGSRVAFYRSEKGGSLSLEDARKEVYRENLTDKDAEELLDSIMRMPTEQINFRHLLELNDNSPRTAQNLWETIKREAKNEFESGHRAAAFEPADYLTDAWNRASYLGLRESFTVLDNGNCQTRKDQAASRKRSI